jgi:predicted metal-binding transcription factor (methanogenesis marker protein 9)
MDKKVVRSQCCYSTVHHLPLGKKSLFGSVIFFCDKCGKDCKVSLIKLDRLVNSK